MFPGVVLSTKASISASVNSGPKRLLSATFFSELQKCFQFALLLTRSLTILGRAGIWTDSLCPASQWKCWKLMSVVMYMGSQGGLVVINRTSHLCDPGSTLATGRMWAEFQSITIWLRLFFSRYSSKSTLLIVIVFVFIYQADIIATIVQSAEQGAAGVVLWGDHLSEKTKTDCIEIKTYIDNFLGPLVKSLTVVTQECSARFCSSHGRCKFRWNFVEYLQALSLGLARDLTHEWTFMSCNCYNGWGGKNCSLRRSELRRN